MMTKMNDTALENVNGGLIVEVPLKKARYIVVDDDGKGCRYNFSEFLDQAKNLADMFGVSQEVISRGEYQARYGVDILY